MSASSLPPCSNVPLEKNQTTCLSAPGLESHSGCVKRSKDHKMGLLTSVPLQATSFHKYYPNFGTGQQCSHSPVRSAKSACKRSHRNGSSSQLTSRRKVVTTGASNSGWGHCTRTNRSSAPGKTRSNACRSTTLR